MPCFEIMERNYVNWFEIPVEDLDRAAGFYEAAFDVKLESMEMPGMAMKAFPMNMDAPHAAGCLIKSEFSKPSADGTLVYFAVPSIEGTVAKIEKAGGQIIAPKMSIGENGFIAQFMDTEGNRVALHCPE